MRNRYCVAKKKKKKKSNEVVSTGRRRSRPFSEKKKVYSSRYYRRSVVRAERERRRKYATVCRGSARLRGKCVLGRGGGGTQPRRDLFRPGTSAGTDAARDTAVTATGSTGRTPANWTRTVRYRVLPGAEGLDKLIRFCR